MSDPPAEQKFLSVFLYDYDEYTERKNNNPLNDIPHELTGTFNDMTKDVKGKKIYLPRNKAMMTVNLFREGSFLKGFKIKGKLQSELKFCPEDLPGTGDKQRSVSLDLRKK